MAALCAFLLALTVSAQVTVGKSTYVLLNSAGGKIGMMLEPRIPAYPENGLLTLKAGDSFVLTAGTLTSPYGFNGYLVAGLVRNGDQLVDVMGKQKVELSSDRPLAYMVGKVSEGVEPMEGDEIRLLTTTDEVEYNFVSAAVGHKVTDRIPAVNYEIPAPRVNLPTEVPGAKVRLGETTLWPDHVVKGRNFYFYVDLDNPEDILVVRANGHVLSPDNNGVYGLSQVMEDIDIRIDVYAQDVLPFRYKEIDITGGQRVADLLTEVELGCLKGLKVTGDLKEEDFAVFRSQMSSLELLDLLDCRCENDYLPEFAFAQNQTLKEIKLPKGLVGSGNNAFYFMGSLEFIVLPEKMCNFGLNEFFGTASLKKVWVKWNPYTEGMVPAMGFPIPPCAFRSTTYTTDGLLIVPKGCKSAYSYTSTWGDWATIREEAPVDKVLMERPFPKNPSSVKNVQVQRIRVIPEKVGCWIVSDGIAACTVEVYDVSGCLKEIRTVDGGRAFMALPAGVHILKADGEAHKILVP